MEATFPSKIQPRLDEMSRYISTEDNSPPLSLETLVDAFVAVYSDCKAAVNQNEQIQGFITKYEKLVNRMQSLRINTNDFDVIKTLATGAVGRVCLVRSKADKNVYAMKVLKKHDLLTRREAQFFMEERNALVFSQQSVWITTLFAAFQDVEHLYLVMEYVSGGSLRALMNNRETIMEEPEARFYMAEMVLALDALHKLNYMHRDIKPENYLIDSKGHIKLADFGSCIGIAEASKITSHETVGTPDYISPEVLRAIEGGASYGLSVDWWSLGIILFELLYDEVPFYSESLTETYGKIMDHEKYFVFPSDIKVSDQCKQLMSKLICSQDVRYKTAEEIMQHEWFAGVNWRNIRETDAPFIPQLSGPEDTRYFEDEDNESKKVAKKALARTKEFSGQSLPFVGYTYHRNATAQIKYGNDRPSSVVQVVDDKLKKQVESLQKNLQLVEQENESLRSNVQKDMQEKSSLEASLSLLEKQKSSIESELRDLKHTFEEEHHIRVELEEKLSNLKKNVESFASNRADNQELSEAKLRLETEINQLTNDLKSEREQALRKEHKIEELNDQIQKLEHQAKHLSDSIQSESEEKYRSVSKLDQAKFEIMQLTKNLATEEEKFQKLQQAFDIHTNELETAKASLQAKEGEVNQMNEQLSETLKSKAILEVEITALQTQLTQTTHEKEVLTKQLQDVQLTKQETDNSEIESLKSQLNNHTLARQKLSEEITKLSKSKMLLDLEIGSIKTSLAQEKEAHEQAKRKLSETQSKFGQMETHLQSSLKAKADTEQQLIELQKTIEEKNAQISANAEQSLKTSQKLQEYESTIQRLNKQVQDLQLKYDMESHNTSLLNTKIESLQQLYSKELKARIAYEAASQDAEEMNAQLTSDIERMRLRIENITRDREERIAEYQSVNAHLATLKAKFQSQEQSRKDLENSNVNLSQEIWDLKRTKLESEESIQLLQQKVTEYEVQVLDLTQSLNKEKTRASELHAKAIDFENMYEAMKMKLDALDSKERDDRSIIGQERKGFRLKGLFFKSSKDNYDEQEVHRRVQSVQSLQSLDSIAASGAPKSPLDAKLSQVDILFAPGDLLAGWIKVPKGGKVKKGWRLQYAIVKEFKIFIYEDETEREGTTGATVIDIATEIFRVSGVSQNEVIHANSRDVDSIFKIQSANPSTVTDKTNVEAERKSQMQKIQASIELEEKMLQATEKILNVTTDAQKVAAISQLDACQKRIRALKAEYEKLQSQSKRSTMIPGSSNDWAFENIAANTEATLRKELEEQLEDELKKRQALSKASSGEKRRSRDLLSLVNQSKDLEVEILSTDRVIAKLKEGIEILDSGDRRKIAELIQKTTESSKKQDSKGHFFSQRQYFKPTDCAVCHESLFESKNQGLECASCKIICHKHCQNHIDMTCALQSKLKSVPPMYIMAKDAVDRARWLIGLNTLRREYEVKTFGSSSLDLKRTSSISERSLTTSSKRNS